MKKSRARKVLSRVTQGMARRVYRLQGKQYIHFLHIGKTGGSAVTSALMQHTRQSRSTQWRQWRLLRKLAPIIGYRVTTAQYIVQLHPHRVKLRDVPKGDYIIFFLRDPISRFVSGFYGRQRQDWPMYGVPWSPDEETAFKNFDTPNKLAIALSSEDKEHQARAKKAMQSIRHVRQSYWEWFESEGHFLSRLSDIFFIGFQESLDQDFERLRFKLGLPDSVKLPAVDDIHAHANPKHLDRSLDDIAVENLKNWYREDFEFFKMCKKYADRINQGGTNFSMGGQSLGDELCR